MDEQMRWKKPKNIMPSPTLLDGKKHKREQAKHLIFLVIFSTKIQVHMLFWGYTFTQIIH